MPCTVEREREREALRALRALELLRALASAQRRFLCVCSPSVVVVGVEALLHGPGAMDTCLVRLRQARLHCEGSGSRHASRSESKARGRQSGGLERQRGRQGFYPPSGTGAV